MILASHEACFERLVEALSVLVWEITTPFILPSSSLLHDVPSVIMAIAGIECICRNH